MSIEDLLTKAEKVRDRLDECGCPELQYPEYVEAVKVIDGLIVYISKGILPPAPEETPKFKVETTNEPDNRGVSQGQTAEVSG